MGFVFRAFDALSQFYLPTQYAGEPVKKYSLLKSYFDIMGILFLVEEKLMLLKCPSHDRITDEGTTDGERDRGEYRADGKAESS